MKYRNINFEDLEYENDSVNLMIESTDELIEIVNSIRKEKGYNDLVEISSDNEVCYNFYLDCHPKENEIKIIAICHNGEHDDYAE